MLSILVKVTFLQCADTPRVLTPLADSNIIDGPYTELVLHALLQVQHF